MTTTTKKPIELEEGWSTMQKGVDKVKRILAAGEEAPSFGPEEYIKLVTIIYDMCTQKPPHDYSEQLYQRYGQGLKNYLESTALPSLEKKHDEFMLRELLQTWKNHNVMIRWLSRFFNYIDRYYVARRSLPDLKETGRLSFKHVVYQLFKVKARDAVLDLIEQEREGEQIDRALLKNVLEIYVAMELNSVDRYVEDFEERFLEESSRYYSRKASNWIVEDSCPDYMVKVEECLRKEEERVSHYLNATSKPKLLKKVEHELLVVKSSQLLEKEGSGCRALLRDDKLDDLSRMYRLFKRVTNGLDPVAAMFKVHVTNAGMVLVQRAEDAATKKAENAGGAQEQPFVRNVIELHDKYFGFVMDCFSNDALFHKSLKESFEVFCNKSVAGVTSAELLSSYCDDILKKGGSEKLSDEAIEETLTKVVKLLAYINDKDLFAEFYRKKLSRRLLFDKSASEEHERSILTKLKQQCGGQFTSKMEGMITDLALAKENHSNFQEYISSNTANPGLDLNVTVLTTGNWPTYKTSDLILPKELVKSMEVYKEFYASKTKSRKLSWIYSLGTCHLNAKFDNKSMELIMTTYQATILLLFNTENKLSYSDIKSQTNLSDDDLVRLLHSLSCAKYKILNKEPPTKSVTRKDSFVFNSKFTDKMRRIRIPLPPVDERKRVVEDVDKDRRFTIDACLVRIMKSRKVLDYQTLVMECIQQLSSMFKPDVKLIKKRIEDLITRDYLERDTEDPNLFKYLA